MSQHPRQRATADATESGFVLVLSLVVLLMLSLLGAWALQTSNFELRVASVEQQAEKQFNLAEGAASSEAGNLGFNRRTFYQVSDPTIFNNLMIPTTEETFDPGNDDPNPANIKPADPNTWPWRNLWPVEDLTDTWTIAPATEKALPLHNDLDYRYLITYLYPDVPPIGYDPSLFAGYRFRIQGNPARTPVIIELGGIKVGVKATL